jgi:hypothetical protein
MTVKELMPVLVLLTIAFGVAFAFKVWAYVPSPPCEPRGEPNPEIALARRIFLVSPTWLFRPATPLRTYVEQTDLTGKEVVLVMTGNTRFKQSEIDAFAVRTGERGGRLIRHIFRRVLIRPFKSPVEKGNRCCIRAKHRIDQNSFTSELHKARRMAKPDDYVLRFV